MTQVLSQVCTRYEIQNPVNDLPDCRHVFVQQLLNYFIINHLNIEEDYADMVHNTSFNNYEPFKPET